jgi:hypothetical protein
VTAVSHPDVAVATRESLEAKILAAGNGIDIDREQSLKFMAESVVAGHPGLESTCLTMIRPLCDDGLDDDEVAGLFAGLIRLTRTAQEVNACQDGDSTGIDRLIDIRVDTLLGGDRYVECTWCDRREDREIAETCDGRWFCTTEHHDSFHGPTNCPEGQL